MRANGWDPVGKGLRVGGIPVPVGAVVALLMVFGVADPLLAQAGEAPSLRPYWHVFVAYAILWALVMGWAVAIGRRLASVEKRLSARMDDPRS